MSNHSECVLCQCSESRLVQVGVRHAPEVEVRRCVDCRLVFLWPRPTGEELGQYYTESYRVDYAEPPIQERYQVDLDEARIRVRRLLSFLRPDTHLLEIGCGLGAFLDAIHPYVAEVVGVEPDAASRDWIQRQMGFPVRKEVDDVSPEIERFDLVVLFHVLEHIPDPVGFLQKVAKLLRPNGKLVVEVPNIDDVLVAVYQIPAYLRFHYQKAHLYYFSRDTLTRAFKQAGFEVTIEGIQRYDLSNHIYWMLKGEPGGQSYFNNILLPSVHAAYADALIHAGHSDTLWAIAQVRR